MVKNLNIKIFDENFLINRIPLILLNVIKSYMENIDSINIQYKIYFNVCLYILY